MVLVRLKVQIRGLHCNGLLQQLLHQMHYWRVVDGSRFGPIAEWLQHGVSLNTFVFGQRIMSLIGRFVNAPVPIRTLFRTGHHRTQPRQQVIARPAERLFRRI